MVYLSFDCRLFDDTRGYSRAFVRKQIDHKQQQIGFGNLTPTRLSDIFLYISTEQISIPAKSKNNPDQ